MPKLSRDSSPRKKSRLDSLQPGSLLDWAILLWLGVTIGYAVWNLGGHHPQAEAGLSVLVGVLLILHGCWVGLQPERPIRFNRLGLIFIPFLLYAYVSYRLVTPTPWWGREEFFVLALGGVIYWVAIHNLREKRQLWILISWIASVGLVSLYFGAREFFEDPTWLPMGRRQFEQYEGRAWGTFGSPNNFGAMMGLLAAFLMLVACTRRISVMARILSGLLTVLFIAGLVMSGSRGGWIGFLGVCMALPYFTAGKGSGRIIAWTVTLAGTTVIILLLYATVPIFKERVDRVFEERGEKLASGCGRPVRRSLLNTRFLARESVVLKWSLSATGTRRRRLGPDTPIMIT